MKITIIVIVSILLVVGSVIAIGAILPKHHVVSRSARYRATREKLFALIAGPQNWHPEVLREEVTSSAADGKLGARNHSQW